MLGRSDGTIEQYTPEGEKKAEIPLPPALLADGDYSPVSIAWLENDLLLVTYNTQVGSSSEPVNDQKQYLVHRQPKASPPVFSFTLFEDILPPWGLERSGNFRNMAHIKNWGQRLRHLAFLSSAPAIDVSVLQGNATSNATEAPVWDILRPDENARPGVPMQEIPQEGSLSDDTTVLGLAVDLTSQDPIHQEMEGGESQPDLPPAPRLLEYTSDGVLVVYNVINARDGRYEHMVKPQDMLTSSHTVATVSSTPSTPTSTAFGLSAKPVAAFGSASGGAKPSFGFGNNTSLPSVSAGFGATSTFGAAIKPVTGVGAPAFGATTFGASASSPAPNKPAFGATAFGQPSAPASTTPAKTAFGTGAFGSSSGGDAASPAANAKPASAFGASPAFGQSAFGASAKPAFGASPFGASPFGASAFGKPAGASPVSSSKPSATGFGFGSASPLVPTGTSKSTSAFGASSAFGAASAFGQPAFGTVPAKAEQTPKDSQLSSPEGEAESKASPFSLGGFGDMLGEEPVQRERREATPPAIKTDSPTTSSFIRPAQSGSFFAKPAAKASPTTPTTPATADSNKSTPSSGVQFGQASGFGNAKPAFGTPAFGAAPTFGSTTSGASTPATEVPASKPLPTTGGFAGFSTPSKLTGRGNLATSEGFASFGTAKASPFGASATPAKSFFSTSVEEGSKKADLPTTPQAVPESKSQPAAVPAVEAESHDHGDDDDDDDDDAASLSPEEALAPEILEDEVRGPEDVEQSFGTDLEDDETYTESEEEEAVIESGAVQEAVQEDELSPSSSSTSDSSSPVLVERPEDTSVAENETLAAHTDVKPDAGANADAEGDATTAELKRGHTRKPSKVHAAAQEWENLANGSDTAEPVKNSPTKFSFDIPATSAQASQGPSSQSATTELPKTEVPNFFGLQPATASASAVPKPTKPFSFGSPPAKPADVPKATYAGVGVQPPSSSSLTAKPNAFGFRTPTTAPARSSPLTNASLPMSESQESDDHDTADSVSTPLKNSEVPPAESPFSSASSSQLSGLQKTSDTDNAPDKSTIPSTETHSTATEAQHGMTKAFSDAYSYLDEELRSVRV